MIWSAEQSLWSKAQAQLVHWFTDHCGLWNFGGCVRVESEIVTIGSPIVRIWLPSVDLGSACKLAPQSLGLPQTERLSTRVSWLILKLREVVPLVWETIYSLGEVMRVTSTGLPDLGLKSVTEV